MVIKMGFVKLITEHDCEFLSGRGRPENVELHEFLFVLPGKWFFLQIASVMV